MPKEVPEPKKEKCQKHLKYEFTQPEHTELAVELAEKLQELSEAQDRLKAVQADVKSDIAAIVAQVSKLRPKVKDRYEMRQIDCEKVYDYARSSACASPA